MYKKTTVFLILTLFVTTCFAIAADKDDSARADVQETSSDAEYWVMRSQALTELIPFLTRSRTEAKGHYKVLTDYLKYIEKGQEFLRSNITSSFNPAEYAKAIGKTEEFVEKNIELPEKPWTWEQLVEFAIEFIKQEGYIPTDVKGADEIEMIKKICRQKAKYGRKVRDELRNIAQNCMDMKAYLESIDQFDAFLKYARYQKEEKENAKKKRMQEGNEAKAAAERARREDRKRNEWQERQERLDNRYYRGKYAKRSHRNIYNRW